MVQLLIIISFFVFLALSYAISSTLLRAGIIGQIIVGIIYGLPLSSILQVDWQETFLVLGYLGLVLIVLEGGLSTRLDLLQKNFFLSVISAATGITIPIALSMALLIPGYGYGVVESFIIGASLSATSLGTTFAVLSGSSKGAANMVDTRVGTILISAAILDDVSGLVMASVIQKLGAGGTRNLGWTIGRPILASILMAVITPPLTKYALEPLYRKRIQPIIKHHPERYFVIMVVILCAFTSTAYWAGTSVLLGAFLSGMCLTYLVPSTPDDVPDPSQLTYLTIFERYLHSIQTYILSPLFFASIGFAIPFLDLWTGRAIWRGVVYSLLMFGAKFVVGMWIPIAQVFEGPSTTRSRAWWPAASFLGLAMVARGEIGLLIIQIGYNESPYVSRDGLVTAVWAILLNTVLGPIGVGVLVGMRGSEIVNGAWGDGKVR